MTRRRADLSAAAAFGVLAVVFLWEGRDLSFTTDRGVPGAGFFPLLTALATAALAVALAAQAVRARPAKGTASDAGPTSDATVVADATGLEQLHGVSGDGPLLEHEEPASRTRTVLVFVLVLVSAVLLTVVGFVPAMLVLSCGIMFGVERRFDPVSIASAVLLPLLTWALFGVLLDVRLPLGVFE